MVGLDQGSSTLDKYQGGSKVDKYKGDFPKGVKGKRQGWFQRFSQESEGGCDEEPRR